MRSQIALLLIIASMTNCATSNLTNKEVAGTYYWSSGLYKLGSEIILNPDSTFIYQWQTGLMTGETKGKWKLKGKRLILNSDKQPEKGLPVSVMNDCLSQNICVVVKEENGGSVPFTQCIIYSKNKIDTCSTDLEGVCIIRERKPIKKIKIHSAPYESITFTPYNQANNHFEFTAKKYYKYFSNVKWIVKHGRLYDKRIKTNSNVLRNYYELSNVIRNP